MGEKSKMLEIDGSMGEGGGSVLRLSIALASIKREPIRVYNIRANRPRPGLANQHLSAVKALQELTAAETKGAKIESEEVIFRPSAPRGRSIGVDIGTAGSTTLILQTMMLPAALANGPVDLEITGGTDNPFAPPIDYMTNVTLPMLRRMGYRGEAECIRRGHFPKGGGKIRGQIQPIEKFDPLNLTELGSIKTISGRSHCVKLPAHVAERQAESAGGKLREEGFDAEIEVEFYKKSEDPHLGPGSGIVLWAETDEGTILGSNSLGEKGKPAEKVGKEAAESLIGQLKTGHAVDLYLTDQLVPYLALAHGRSEITSTELTSHAITNVELVRKILGTDIEVRGKEGEKGKIVARGSNNPT